MMSKDREVRKTKGDLGNYTASCPSSSSSNDVECDADSSSDTKSSYSEKRTSDTRTEFKKNKLESEKKYQNINKKGKTSNQS